MGARELERLYGPGELCGVLAFAAGLKPDSESTTPAELVEGFAWSRVREHDRLATLDGEALVFSEPDQGEEKPPQS